MKRAVATGVAVMIVVGAVVLAVGGLPTFDEAISRSVTIHNQAGSTPVVDEAVSRSVTILNEAGGSPVIAEAISRSVTILNQAGNTIPGIGLKKYSSDYGLLGFD